MELSDLLDELVEFGVKNETIRDNYIKAYKIVNNPDYNVVVCSISGGSDSDIMLDIIHRVDYQKKVRYVWFNTGMEYQATKDHLDYLEKRYNIKIERRRAIKPIPLAVRQHGQPFLSKLVSNRLHKLQLKGFQFEDDTFENIIEKYCYEVPKGTRWAVEVRGKYYRGGVDAIKWWCNKFCTDDSGFSRFNINRNKYLKEFMIKNPPTFDIDNSCCDYSKKNPAKKFRKEVNCDLSIIGVRKSEGGIRATAYKNCFTENEDKNDEYRPLFFYLDKDKKDYERYFDIRHSDCYEKWGFKRTGCVGCPYNINILQELETVENEEPKLAKACKNVFKDSYEYTRQYRQFVAEMKRKEKGHKKLFDVRK